MTQQCEYAKYINACIEGTLDEERTEALFAHMAEHPECQALFDSALGMSDVLSSLSAEVPEGFSASVMEKVRSEASAAKARKPFPIKRVVSLAVAAAAVVALAFFGASRLNIAGKKSAASESVSATGSAMSFDESAVITEGTATAGFSVMTSGAAPAAADAQTSSIAGGSSFFSTQKSASADASCAENGLAEESEAEAVLSSEEPSAFPADSELQAGGALSEATAPEAAAGEGSARQADKDGFVRERYNAYVEIHGEVPEAFSEYERVLETEDCVYYLVPPAVLDTVDYDYIERYELNSTPALVAVFPNG